MSRMKSNLLGLAVMMAALSYEGGYHEDKHEPKKQKRNPKKVIPKGCKEYYFTRTGSIFTSHNENIVFTTIASSEKSAQKKFDKWYNQNPQPNESNTP